MDEHADMNADVLEELRAQFGQQIAVGRSQARLPGSATVGGIRRHIPPPYNGATVLIEYLLHV